MNSGGRWLCCIACMTEAACTRLLGSCIRVWHLAKCSEEMQTRMHWRDAGSSRPRPLRLCG